MTRDASAIKRPGSRGDGRLRTSPPSPDREAICFSPALGRTAPTNSVTVSPFNVRTGDFRAAWADAHRPHHGTMSITRGASAAKIGLLARQPVRTGRGSARFRASAGTGAVCQTVRACAQVHLAQPSGHARRAPKHHAGTSQSGKRVWPRSCFGGTTQEVPQDTPFGRAPEPPFLCFFAPRFQPDQPSHLFRS